VQFSNDYLVIISTCAPERLSRRKSGRLQEARTLSNNNDRLFASAILLYGN
jgi:hypothetical protein